MPNLDEVSRQLRAIREDPNLTIEEKFEKSHEIFAKLTAGQGRQVFQNDIKKIHYEQNAEMQKFLKMSPEEQAAYLKKQVEERKQLGQKGGGAIFLGPPGGANTNKLAGPANPNQMQRTMLDNFSPETRAGQSYQKGLSK